MRHRLTRLLPYTPRQLFELVGDVERYPEFVPWIIRLKAWNRRPAGEGVAVLDAEAQVGFSAIHERFVTRVRLDEPALTVSVSLLAGPFRRLENRWAFAEHMDGTEVTFEIDFEFKSRVLDRLLAANFHMAVNRLIACFETRAAELYGPGKS